MSIGLVGLEWTRRVVCVVSCKWWDELCVVMVFSFSWLSLSTSVVQIRFFTVLVYHVISNCVMYSQMNKCDDFAAAELCCLLQFPNPDAVFGRQ